MSTLDCRSYACPRMSVVYKARLTSVRTEDIVQKVMAEHLQMGLELLDFSGRAWGALCPCSFRGGSETCSNIQNVKVCRITFRRCAFSSARYFEYRQKHGRQERRQELLICVQ